MRVTESGAALIVKLSSGFVYEIVTECHLIITSITSLLGPDVLERVTASSKYTSIDVGAKISSAKVIVTVPPDTVQAEYF